MQDVIHQIDRLRKVYSVRTDTALAEKLGKDKNTVSVWKRRTSIPLEVLKRVSFDENVSLDWLISGKGQMRSMSTDEVIDTTDMLGALFADERSIKIVKLLRYAPREFIDKMVERLEEYKRLSSDI